MKIIAGIFFLYLFWKGIEKGKNVLMFISLILAVAFFMWSLLEGWLRIAMFF